ncbi:MAG: apolipoprotein N-acyltransferase [Micrococcales bacterium]|nr:apolipoprotein N-acyltransferase [Micrococcales bacterium]
MAKRTARKRGRQRGRGVPLALVGAAAGGILGAQAFPPVGAWVLAPVSAALLMASLAAAGPFLGFGIATVYGLAFFGPLLTWAAAAAGPVEWLALVVAASLMWGLLGAGWSTVQRMPWLARRPAIGAAAFATLWTASDELRAIAPFSGFPWGRLAFTQADSPLGHLAILGGTPLVTAVTVLVGALLVVAARSLLRGNTWAATGLAVTALALALGPLVIGLDSRPQSGTMTIAGIQGNVPEPGSLPRREEIRAVFDNHLNQTNALADRSNAAGGVGAEDSGGGVGEGESSGATPDANPKQPIDLVVWPEDSADHDPQTHPDEAEALTKAARTVGAPILVGIQEFPDSGGRRNVTLLWDPEQGAAIGRYVKRHPVPFGEYMPLRGLAELVSKAAREVTTDMIPGEEPGVMNVQVKALGRGVPVGVAICFEVVYDPLMADLVKHRAEILVVQTNNASFGRTGESEQQLAASRLRAIEHGRAVVHVSTTGVSGMISPSGVLLDKTGFWEPGVMVVSLPLRTSITPATHIAGALSWAFLVLGAGLAVAASYQALTHRRRDGR